MARMSRIHGYFALCLVWATAASAESVTVAMHAITAKGIGDKVGTVTIAPKSGGVALSVNVKGMSDGEHGFHVHDKGDCGPGIKDGKMSAGIAAGDHFDPLATNSHKGPHKLGHKGDLPKLTAASMAIAQTVEASLSLAEIAGRSLIIHEGGDTYSDQPESGGGKARIVCGVIPKI